MSRNARSENAKMRSIQRSVQVFLVVAGIGLLVAGLALAASGASVDDAVDTISEKWSDPASTETGTDTTPDGGGATDDQDGNNESGDSDAAGSDSAENESGDDTESDGDDEAADGTDDTNGGDGGDNSDVEDNESAVGGETNESADTHTLTVTVDNESGDPLENATVAVDATDAGNSLHNETTTDGTGEAEFDLENGEYNLTVSADGYEDAQETVEISGNDVDIALTLEASDVEQNESGPDGTDDDAADNESSTLTVFVVDGDGNPVENATVEATESGLFGDSTTNTTNADGEAEFDLEDGEYDLTVSADGYEDTQDTVEINGEDEEVLMMLEESG